MDFDMEPNSYIYSHAWLFLRKYFADHQQFFSVDITVYIYTSLYTKFNTEPLIQSF